jgi:hypothetical protein
VRHGLAAVQIGEESNPQAGESCGQPGHAQRLAGELYVMATVQLSVAHAAGERANSCRRRAPQQIASTEAP